MMRVIQAVVQDETLFLDGSPVNNRSDIGASLRNCHAFYPVGTNARIIEKLLSSSDSSDSAWVSRGGYSPSYIFRHKRGNLTIKPATSWGSDSEDPDISICEVTENMQACIDVFGKVCRTLSSTTGLIRRMFLKDIRQLQPQFRLIAHQAIFQGPTLALRGGCKNGIEIDRISSFLRGMRDSLPKHWTPYPGARWNRVRRLDGIVRARVRVDADFFDGRLPPLPIRTAIGTVYPVGEILGYWIISLLREAEEYGGIEVLDIEDCSICSTSKEHSLCADFIDGIPEKFSGDVFKRLRKYLYTRYWGTMCSVGGFEGTPDKRSDTDVKIFGSCLYWRWSGDTLLGQSRPDYRPDVSAFIAGNNHRSINRVLSECPADSVVGVHVDAIWYDSDVVTLPHNSEYKVKRSGELRFYGTGTYEHDNTYHAQGCPYPIRDHATMEQWGNKVRPHAGRKWVLDQGPNLHSHATSMPPMFSQKNFFRHCWPKTDDVNIWNEKGRPSKDFEEENRDKTILDMW